jgi:hypothetical protein
LNYLTNAAASVTIPILIFGNYWRRPHRVGGGLFLQREDFRRHPVLLLHQLLDEASEPTDLLIFGWI